MKKFKFLRTALACSLLIATVAATAGCTGTKSNVLKIGVDDVYPPMEYKDDAGKTIGFDIEFANAIGQKMGKEVQFVSTAWDGIFTALNAKKYDMIISAVSITDERKQNYLFSDPYIANAQVFIVPTKDTSIKSEKDFKGKNVGVQTGTTADESADKFLKEVSFNKKQYEQIIQPFADMKIGRLDAIIVDEVVGKYYVNQDKASFKLAGTRLSPEPIGVCFRKSDTQLRDQVQKAINDLKADGTLKKISEKWFGEDLTSNIK